jgi:hypothetical protein
MTAKSRSSMWRIAAVLSVTVVTVVAISVSTVREGVSARGVVFALGGLAALTTLLSPDSPLAVAGSTLSAAALFNPVRKRVQSWVDRHFNRSRYDAQLVVVKFAGSLRERVDSEDVVEGWVGVVSQTMQPAAAGVWVRESR